MNATVKEVFLHIGTTKTGTSSLQYAFYNLRSNLLENGISYPVYFESDFGWKADRGMGAGNADVDGFLDWANEDRVLRLKYMIEKSLSEKEADKSLFISEHLSPLAIQNHFWQMLKDVEENFNCKVRVISYVRDPFKMFLACYQQVVKLNGYVGQLNDFVNIFETANSPLSFIFQRNIDLISKLAGDSKIDLQLYRYEDCLPEVEKHFFKEVLNIDLGKLNFEPNRINTSISPSVVEFHRGVNSVSRKLGQLLGFERSDTLLAQNIRNPKIENDKYLLGTTQQDALSNIFDDYKEKLSSVCNFADKVDYSIDSEKITNKLSEFENLSKNQIYELGRFVASSYETGYVQWNWKNENNR